MSSGNEQKLIVSVIISKKLVGAILLAMVTVLQSGIFPPIQRSEQCKYKKVLKDVLECNFSEALEYSVHISYTLFSKVGFTRKGEQNFPQKASIFLTPK